ncbi:MAG: T9SS type A sorting domain-containing protein [Bacteroidota bacterium]
MIDNVGSYSDGGIVIKTLDGGESWEVLPTGFFMYPTAIKFTNINEGYIAGKNWDYSDWMTWVIKTKTGGLLWQEVLSDTIGSFLSIDFPSQQVGYIQKLKNHESVYEVCIYKTTDSGDTWNSIFTNDTIYPGAISFPTEETGYMIIQDSRILKTIDGGYTWTTLTGFNHFPASNISFINPMIGFVLCSNFIWETTDGGISWTSSELITSNPLMDLFFFSLATGYVVGVNCSILYTPDDYFPVFQHETVYNTVNFISLQPNPVSNIFTINYTINEMSDVCIELYKLSGERIYPTYKMRQSAGKHEFKINATELPSGLYLCKVKANKKIETEKVVVIH